MSDQRAVGVVTAVGGLIALIGAIVLLILRLDVPTYLWLIACAGLGLGGFIYPTRDRTE